MEGNQNHFKVVLPDEVEQTLTAAVAPEREETPLILDVRTPGEYQSHRIPGALLIPIHELGRRFIELDPDRPTICVCEHGIRSEAAAALLARQDFANVATMRGGMVHWKGPVERGRQPAPYPGL